MQIGFDRLLQDGEDLPVEEIEDIDAEKKPERRPAIAGEIIPRRPMACAPGAKVPQARFCAGGLDRGPMGKICPCF